MPKADPAQTAEHQDTREQDPDKGRPGARGKDGSHENKDAGKPDGKEDEKHGEKPKQRGPV